MICFLTSESSWMIGAPLNELVRIISLPRYSGTIITLDNNDDYALDPTS